MSSFDTVIDRNNTGALKLDVLKERYGRDDLLPLWVADMDFASPDFIIDAIRKRLQHPILGYTVTPPELWPTVVKWTKDHHDWDISEDWLTFIPGVVKGIGFAVNVFTKPDEKVIIQTPVYHHFRITPEGNGRQVVVNPLKLGDDGIYHMDFEHLASIVDDKCRMLILCNPHNPGGVVWDRDTLVKLADFCMEHHILVVSDEIHCDMALWDNKHIPFASVSEAAAHNSITLAAPTKTFNIAGVVSAYAVVPDEKIRHKFFEWLEMNEFSEPPMFSPIVAIAAFQRGEQWRREMIAYLQDNINFVIRFCEKDLPGIKALRPQASFLVWLDCRGLGMNHEQLNDFFVNKAHLALNDGEMFGPGGEGFMRLNVGTPRSILMEALNRLNDTLLQF